MHLLNTIRPSLYQKQALARIIGAATPKLANAAIMANRNLISARDTLMKLGAITVVGDTADLTSKGMQLATDENIVDPSGSLTDTGTKLSTDEPEQPEQPDQAAVPPADGAPAAAPTGDDLSLESFALLKEILR